MGPGCRKNSAQVLLASSLSTFVFFVDVLLSENPFVAISIARCNPKYDATRDRHDLPRLNPRILQLANRQPFLVGVFFLLQANIWMRRNTSLSCRGRRGILVSRNPTGFQKREMNPHIRGPRCPLFKSIQKAETILPITYRTRCLDMPTTLKLYCNHVDSPFLTPFGCQQVCYHCDGLRSG